MATTTNYGWTTPDNTDLVKNGALAIRTLGSAIDTSMNTALGTKKAGMVLLNTTSFSAVASQSINDVFSATYDNYAIVVSAVFTNAGSINMRLRVSGSDNTTANAYVRQVVEANNTSVTTSRTTTTTWPLGGFGTALINLAIVDITNPFLASATGFFSRIERSLDSAVVHISSGTHNQTTSYTGFTIYPDAGTMTGSVRTYGYNQ